MSLNKVNPSFVKEVETIEAEGRAKKAERVIVDYIPPQKGRGPRYKLAGSDMEFIRMNSNSYLDLSCHPKLIKAADEATHRLGVGPGAVRFIDGTFQEHISLEKRVADFVEKPAAKIFNSAYTSNLALALAISNKTTYWIGDELNHNSIIRAMRISNIPRTNRDIFKHNNMDDLKRCLESVPEGIDRVCIIFDGIFSMRGDCAPMAEIKKLADLYHDRFSEGVITIVDDSHGIGAYGEHARGTSDYTQTDADIIVGTFGKAFGVNGGFIAASSELIELVRQKSDTYIYTNPLSVADCAAATEAISIADSNEGLERLLHLHARISQFRSGLETLGLESIEGPHPVVPILIRDTAKTHNLVQKLYEKGVLLVGLTFPVVPKGSETIRAQINAGLTESDIDYVLSALKEAL